MSLTRCVSLRQAITYLAVVGVILVAQPYGPAFILGSSMAIVGIAIRVWGCGHLRKNQQLTISGPYAYVQHPLYLGTFLIAVGGIIAAGSPSYPGVLIWSVVGPVFLLLFLTYYLPKKKGVEGRRLAERFPGSYPEYQRHVPAFLPTSRPYPGGADLRWCGKTFRNNHELGMDLLIVALFSLLWLAPRLRPWP